MTETVADAQSIEAGPLTAEAPCPAPDAAVPSGSAPADDVTARPDVSEEEARAAAERAAAAERELREARASAERRVAAAEQAQARAAAAVEAIGGSAGFVTSYGAYYDVKAARGAEASAEEARARVEALAAARAQDGGVPAPDDPSASAPDSEAPACDAPDEGSYVDDVTFSRQVARLTESVARQPLHREILYKTLVFCEESRPLHEIEEAVAAFPEFKHAANNPYHFVQVLEQAGGLERFELDEGGEVVTPERKEGLTEDEVDDLVAGYAFMTTPAGLAVVEQHTPRARIIELLGLVPERRDTYVELLEFCAAEPRTYGEIAQLLVGRPALVRLVDGEPQTMQPSVFVDKLEAAGGMEWADGGWVLTDEGRAYLEELRG